MWPRPKKPKGPKRGEWLEDQDDELVRIYQEFKGTDDPVGNISNALSFQKSKGQIINHLLQLGIVRDRKELYKKRRRKANEPAGGNGRDIDDDNDDDDGFIVDEEAGNSREGDGDEDEILAADGSRDASRRRESDSDDENLPDIDDDNLRPDAALAEILARLRELGFGSQISWIQDRLQRLGNDREKESRDTWQPVPLVTFTEENEEALRSKLFQRMLKIVGVKPPASEQETFWRIPVQLDSVSLKKAVEDLDQEAEDEAGPSSAQQPEPATRNDNHIDDGSSSDDDLPLQSASKPNKRAEKNESTGSEEEPLIQSCKKQPKKRKNRNEDSISDMSDGNTLEDLHKMKSKKEKRGKKHVGSDSSDEEISLQSLREKKPKRKRSVTKPDKPSGSGSKPKSVKEGNKLKKKFSVSEFLKEKNSSASESESNNETEQTENFMNIDQEDDIDDPGENLEKDTNTGINDPAQEQPDGVSPTASPSDQHFENSTQGNVEESAEVQLSHSAVTYDEDLESDPFVDTKRTEEQQQDPQESVASVDAATYDPHLENDGQFDTNDDTVNGTVNDNVRDEDDHISDKIQTLGNTDPLRNETEETGSDNDSNATNQQQDNTFKTNVARHGDANENCEDHETAAEETHSGDSSEGLNDYDHLPGDDVDEDDRRGTQGAEAELSLSETDSKYKKRSRKAAFPDSSSDDEGNTTGEKNINGFANDGEERKYKKRTRVLDDDEFDLPVVNINGKIETDPQSLRLELSYDEDSTAADVL